MNIAIVDDNYIHRQNIKQILKQVHNVHNIDEFSSGEAFLSSHTVYDIVLLDVEMDCMSGIDVKNSIQQNIATKIIFVSSYTNRVMDAFGQNVIAYLHKDDPVLANKLVNLVYTLVQEKQIEIDGEIVFLSQIIYCSGGGSYTHIYTHNKEWVMRKTLSEVSEQLDSTFYRIHKSFIVNLKYIKKIYYNKVVLHNGEQLKISRTSKKQVQEAYLQYMKGVV